MPLNLSQGTDDYLTSSSSRQQRRQQQQHHHNQQNKLSIDVETLQLWWTAGIEWTQTTFRDRVRLETLRPLPMFLGINTTSMCLAPDAFGPPVKHLDKSTLEKTKSRLSLNLAFFVTNYVLVVVAVSTVVALMHPAMLLFVGVLYGLWALHSAWGTYEVQIFGLDLHPYLSHGVRAKVLTVLTTVVVLWKCLWPVITAAILSALIVLTHALLRDPKHIELNDDHHHDGTATRRGSGSDNDDEEGGTHMSESAVLVERPLSSATSAGTTTATSRLSPKNDAAPM